MAKRPILIVADDPGVVSQLAAGFLAKGHRVETASNGEEALRVVGRIRPMFVLIDTEMPVLDGRGFARELRAQGLDLPLVLLCDAGADPRIAAEIGAIGYWSKPRRGTSANGKAAAA
jgi:DNA-binding response OmpR family regulator